MVREGKDGVGEVASGAGAELGSDGFGELVKAVDKIETDEHRVRVIGLEPEGVRCDSSLPARRGHEVCAVIGIPSVGTWLPTQGSVASRVATKGDTYRQIQVRPRGTGEEETSLEA